VPEIDPLPLSEPHRSEFARYADLYDQLETAPDVSDPHCRRVRAWVMKVLATAAGLMRTPLVEKEPFEPPSGD
jgi:hypothetical protein